MDWTKTGWTKINWTKSKSTDMGTHQTIILANERLPSRPSITKQSYQKIITEQ